jgi:D-alanyl-D-alanine dipeptidase
MRVAFGFSRVLACGIAPGLALAFAFGPPECAAQSADDELVNVKHLLPDIVLDLRYNTVDNFCDQKLYTTDECLVAHGVARRLQVIQDTLRARGLGLKIFDAYRPRSVQYLMFEIVPNPVYVADPATGSVHNRGGAVDVSLVNTANGLELAMPTEFDDFSDMAHHGWTIGLTAEQVANRELLLDIMTRVGGFTSYAAEWWHYTLASASDYPLLDFQLR